MPMLKAENMISNKVRDILPSDYQGKPYNKMKVGDVKTIVQVVYSVYPVVEKDKNGKIVYDDNGLEKIRLNAKGDVLLNCTAYLLFDDDTISSIKFRTAVNQLVSLTGAYPWEEGTYHSKDFEPCKVKIIPSTDRYGDVERDTIAFDPLD